MNTQVKLFLIQLLFDKKITFFPDINNQKFWNNLVKISSSQIIIPTVYFKLNERGLLKKIPNDLKDYLFEIYSFNKKRNQSMVNEINSIHKILNDNNINFFFLKGSYLLRTIYKNNIGIRMMHDIDILVKEDQIYLAKNIFEKMNYKDRGFENKILNEKHIPRLINNEKNIGLEIHYKLTEGKKNFFNYNNLFQNNLMNSLSINDNLNHIILNSEYNDNGAILGRINLRSFFDFYNLNRINNDFDFNKNNYTKIFYNKLLFLKIINTHTLKNYFYTVYLIVSNTKLGKIIPFTIFYFLRLKLLVKQLIEFIFNINYRRNVYKIIKSYFEK